MISEPAQYILNLTNTPYGMSKGKLKERLVSMTLAIRGGLLREEDFEKVFAEAKKSGQMTEYDGEYYSNERYEHKEALVKLMG